MALLLNLAGATIADPILKGLGVEVGADASSMNLAQVNDAAIDQAPGFPVTNTVRALLSPAPNVTTRGNNGSYDDTTKFVNVGNTTGLAAGDIIYLSHASITDGRYRVLSLDADGQRLRLVSNPFDGGGNVTGIAFQIAWRYLFTAGTAPSSSSAAGTLNYWKFDGEDDVQNKTQQEDVFYVRDAPAGALFIAIDGKAYDGVGATSDPTPTLDLLPAWASKGGVSHVALANHSVMNRNDFTFSDSSVTQRSLASALASGLKLSAGDGAKYGRLLLRSLAGAATERAVDIQITLDTTGPQIELFLNGA